MVCLQSDFLKYRHMQRCLFFVFSGGGCPFFSILRTSSFTILTCFVHPLNFVFSIPFLMPFFTSQISQKCE